jgi:hypothetical protein
MTETERNCLARLERTLADLGSETRQRRYKTAVPFVHIPIELEAQCDTYVHLLETEWYRALFDADEIAALSAFFAQVGGYVGRDMVLDVDDGVLDDPAWREVMAAARSLHSRLIAAGRILPTTSAS